MTDGASRNVCMNSLIRFNLSRGKEACILLESSETPKKSNLRKGPRVFSSDKGTLSLTNVSLSASIE